jgi:hypothetical protein
MLVMKAKGSMSQEEFITLAMFAKNELTNPKSFLDWENEFEQNITDTAFLRLYMEKRALLGKSNDALFDKYLAILPNDQRVSKGIINIYQREIDNIKIHSLAYDNLQENRSTFTKLGAYFLLRSSAITNSIHEAIANRNEPLLEEVIAENEKIPKLIRSKQKEEIYMNYYESVGDLEKYTAYAITYSDSWLMNKEITHIFSEVYGEKLNMIAWGFYEKVTDNNALKNALRWSKRSLEISPNNYMYLDTYAHILHKLGKKTKAVQTQTRALDLVRATNDVEKIAEYEQALQKMKLKKK